MATISAQEAQRLQQEGAILVDIRGSDEFAREYISAAIQQKDLAMEEKRKIIFYCQSGLRTQMQAEALAARYPNSDVLQGGLSAWKKEGFPTVQNKKAPISLQRQVFLVLGSALLLGFILKWFWLSALIGAGMVFAGASGHCLLAVLLAKLPWNQNAASCSFQTTEEFKK